MIYAQGTRNYNNYGISYSNNRTRNYASRGTSQSLLAARCNPPTQEILSPTALIGLSIATLSFLMFAFNLPYVFPAFILGLGFILVSAIGRQERAEKYQAKLDLWDKTWLCKKCGTSYTVTPKEVTP